MVVPRVFLAGRFTRGPAVVVLTRTSRTITEMTGHCSHAQAGGSGPVSQDEGRSPGALKGNPQRESISSRHAPRAHPWDRSPSGSKTMRSTPQRHTPSQFRLILSEPVRLTLSEAGSGPFLSPQTPLSGTDKPSTAGRHRPAEWLVQEPFLGATGGTQTHSRRTDKKLGRLRDVRQGLVRVSESNTKYGGKRGKTEGVARL